MEEENNNFKFEFSLEVLNHLGRGLYRSFATVIAEAISNSWDAEATEVFITIEKDKLVVEDNGKGMDKQDFREKFLKVGYSRRQDKDNQSKQRSVIGRKGIGKLAMLSISEKVVILSKKQDKEITGGKINNPELDKKIKEDGNYSLEDLSGTDKEELFDKDKKSGTKIIFEDIKTSLNSEDIIRKYLATQFNFIFSLKEGDTFKVIVNEKEVTIEDLKELNDNTQFIWFLNDEDKEIKDRYKNLDREKVISNTSFLFNEENIEIKGFVASVKKSSQLLLKGSKGDFKAGISLFCNGRLRQEGLFEEIAKKTLTEEYLYGEIHVDGFEDDGNDRFTSSREGIIKDDPLYQKFLKELEKIQNIIIQNWTPWRNELKQEGDIEQDNRPAYEVRMNDSRNRREKYFREKLDESIEDKSIKSSLKTKLKDLSYKNTMVYQDLFILENIFREYIKVNNINEEDLDPSEEIEKEIIESINLIRKFRTEDEERHALKGKIVKEEDYLNYLDLGYLADLIDIKIHKIDNKKKKNQKGVDSDAKEINPVRNTVMHTNEITDEVMDWPKIKNVIDYIDRLENKK